MLSPDGRSTTTRRVSHAALHVTNPLMQWPSPETLRRANTALQSRRRALDLYDTKDVLLSHEQIKKARLSTGNSKGPGSFG